jgi:hypothetical protein
MINAFKDETEIIYLLNEVLSSQSSISATLPSKIYMDVIGFII